MRFLVFALIMALMVSMLTADGSRRRHSDNDRRRHRHRDRRDVSSESEEEKNYLRPSNIRTQPYPYPNGYPPYPDGYPSPYPDGYPSPYPSFTHY